MTYSTRTYNRLECITFAKVNAPYGWLHCMSAYPVEFGGVTARTAEHLFQALRFPDRPDIQEIILAQASPITAKMKMREHQALERPDWQEINVKVMDMCLRLKLLEHWDELAPMLMETGDTPLVEYSTKDDFWGAMPKGCNALVGVNALGRLWMGIREEVRVTDTVCVPIVENLTLMGNGLLGEETY